MKNIVMAGAMLVFTAGFAQDQKTNINESEKTVTTKTTVETDEGKKTMSKKAKIIARKELELKNDNVKKVNYELEDRPYKVAVITSYNMDGDKYKFTPDKKGFVIDKLNENSGKMMRHGKARSSTTNDGFYIITSKKNDGAAYGRFDAEGNLVIQKYDPKKDEVRQEVYRIDENQR